MKNIFLTLVLLLTVSFAFAGNSLEKFSKFNSSEALVLTTSIDLTSDSIKLNANLVIQNTLEMKILENENYPCRWRICTYVNGVKIGCTPWEYGECLPEVDLGTVK